MNVISFSTKLTEKNVKGYAVERSRRVIELGFKMLKCSTVEEVLSKLDFVYDNIETFAKWTVPATRIGCFSTLNSALDYFPMLKSKVPKEYWAKLKTIKQKKRKLIVDTASDEVNIIVQNKKKIKLIPVSQVINKPITINDNSSKLSFYELSMNDTLWKIYFVRKGDEVFINQRSSKVKFNINNDIDIKNYVIRVLEALIKDACSINTSFKCKLKYGQDNMNDIIINNATKNIRDVANHIWTEMIEPFYNVSMAV
jgi:hypothetical protein